MFRICRDLGVWPEEMKLHEPHSASLSAASSAMYARIPRCRENLEGLLGTIHKKRRSWHVVITKALLVNLPFLGQEGSVKIPKYRTR